SAFVPNDFCKAFVVPSPHLPSTAKFALYEGLVGFVGVGFFGGLDAGLLGLDSLEIPKYSATDRACTSAISSIYSFCLLPKIKSKSLFPVMKPFSTSTAGIFVSRLMWRFVQEPRTPACNPLPCVE